MKIRRIDLYPDDFIAGVSGQMDEGGLGVYWMVCLLIYSTGKPVKNDPVMIAAHFSGSDLRRVKNRLASLILTGKLILTDGYLSSNRCVSELHRAGKRVVSAAQNGRKGGRPSKEIKEVTKAPGCFSEKLTTNIQQTTDSEAKASATPAAMAVDSKALIFGEQLAWLREVSGKTDGSLRAWLGKCCARFGESQTLASILTIRSNPTPVDPIARMRFLLEKNGGFDGKSNSRGAGVVAAFASAVGIKQSPDDRGEGRDPVEPLLD